MTAPGGDAAAAAEIAIARSTRAYRKRWRAERAAAIRDLRYDLTFSIPPSEERARPGSRRRQPDAAAPSRLVFDFAQPRESVRRVTVDGGDAGADFVNGHIVVPAKATRAGVNRIEIEFVAGDAALNRNDEFLYTLFVPARARLAFPCFDQPDLKARYRLKLSVPEGWQAVANGASRSADARSAERARRDASRVRGDAAAPTYLFAFAAGKFSVETATRNGRAFRMFHRETDAAKVARNRDALFDLHARALALARGIHLDSVSMGQVRLRPDSVVSVRRHGARRRDSLQRLRPDARRVGHAEPVARARQRHRARDRAHVVRRPRHDAVVRRCVDEGGVRELHGGEDREPVVPRSESRAAIPARASSRRVSGRSHVGDESDSSATREPRRRGPDCTGRSFTRRRRS